MSFLLDPFVVVCGVTKERKVFPVFQPVVRWQRPDYGKRYVREGPKRCQDDALGLAGREFSYNNGNNYIRRRRGFRLATREGAVLLSPRRIQPGQDRQLQRRFVVDTRG